ncbi:MAG: hypothetical protein M1479_00345 [Actinobacteria bacterium]|nr:hypothetical protein [Actinomycetota bacterium]
MTLIELEKKYSKNFFKNYKQLIKLYDEIKSSIPISLENKDITKAILLRMKAYYEAQYKIKSFLNKKYAQSASDFFVETIIFYLKLFLEKNNIDIKAFSEKLIKLKGLAIRPDISIWKEDKIVLIIECKTQLGWNRNKWEDDFIKRDLVIKKMFPHAKSFLLIMTSNNWSGIPKEHKKSGKQYFILSNDWLSRIDEDKIDTYIINPIEDLFKYILL